MNTVRIIGGANRRRVLKFPDALGLRPTPDRVRETVFNWLGQDLWGQTCLDVFAGSGALGFEAASRGAAMVTLVESAASVAKALEDNRRLLGMEGVKVVRGDALQFAARAVREGQSFDVVFADPPYRLDVWPKLWPLMVELVRPGGLMYGESDAALVSPAEFALVRQGKAGQVCYHLFERQASVLHEGGNAENHAE